MNCKYKLIFLFLCGFTGLTVAGEECKENQLEGTSCTMKLKLKSTEKTAEVKWTHDKSEAVARRKNNKDTVKDGFRLEVDGSLTFIKISLTESGLYDFSAYDSDGSETGHGQNKMKVYAKVPKPDLQWTCNTDGNFTLTCNAGNGEDLQYTWFDGTNPIENKHTKTLILPAAKLQVNNPYSCSAKNNVSEARSESKTVPCQDVKRAVGDDVTFHPDNIPSPTTSIIWKHTDNAGIMVKAIEWDNVDGVDVANPKFEDIATLDDKTGEITLTGLKLHHSGVYSIEINSKEQQNKFTLTVMEPVPKPEISIEPTGNHDVKILICYGDATIIWKNSAGEILRGEPISGPPKGESIAVTNTQNRDNYYTCTLKNDVSEKTSDPVYEKDLFPDSGPSTGLIIFLVIFFVLLFLGILACLLYIFTDKIHGIVQNSCGKVPIFGGVLGCLDRFRKKTGTDNNENPDDPDNERLNELTASPNEGKNRHS